METAELNTVEQLNENSFQNEEQNAVDGGGEENNDNEISDMDQLPNEILIRILDNLDEQQLVKCRLLNSRWNEISCFLLQDKTKTNLDSKLIVQLKGNMECKIIVTKRLQDFLNCFGPSEAEKSSGSGRRRPFPFSCFSVQNLKFMDMSQLCEFVSTYGPQMKTVTADINQEDSAKCQSFWKLLLHFAPNVQHLKIIDGDYCLKNIVLFDPAAEFIAEFDPNFKAVNPNDTFLKNLITLKIVSTNFGLFNDFMKDVLDNSPNLEQVSCVDPPPFSHENDWKKLAVWQELNNAHLLKKLYIRCFFTSHLSPVQLMRNLRLETLCADCKLPNGFVEQETSATNYIAHALKSSAETLSIIKFRNLDMQYLELAFKYISSLPNVRQLEITIDNPEDIKNILERFGQVCPNTTNLKLEHFGGNFSKFAPILWTRFKGLESLKLGIYLTVENPLDLDSAFSGYSKISLWKIKTRMNVGISVEAARQVEPQKPSILDLKGLSRLELSFLMGERNLETENMENQLQNSIFIKMLPQNIRENPLSISYRFSG